MPLAVGTWQLPFSGSVGVLTSGGANTNFSAGSGDTIIVWGSGAALFPAPAPWDFFVLGVFVVVALFGLLATVRRIANHLVGQDYREV
jgi:hypothetical protein